MGRVEADEDEDNDEKDPTNIETSLLSWRPWQPDGNRRKRTLG
jgi:hypothetical protein